MVDMKEKMAIKVQAAARGYLMRKMGLGGKTGGKHGKVGKAGKHGKKKKKTKSEDMQAKIIQAAFKKYSAYSKKH